MILKMTDRTEMFVSQSEGEAIRKALTKSETGFITVRGTTLKKSAVLKLEEGGVDPMAPGFFDAPSGTIKSGKVCKGRFSIQREINQIIKTDYPENWPGKIGDKKLREQIRLQLREQPGVMWCDAKAGECAC